MASHTFLATPATISSFTIIQNSRPGILNSKAHFNPAEPARLTPSGANLGGLTYSSQLFSGVVEKWRTRQDSNL